MQIKATTKPLRVDYRVAGKRYNENSEGGHYNNDTASTYPFDSVDLAVDGPGVELSDDTTVVRIVRVGGLAVIDAEPTPA